MLRINPFDKINYLFKVNPVVAILGPRQCGKTTIAQEFLKKDKKITKHNYFDLEKMSDLAALSNPEAALSHLEGLIVIDEIQKIPALLDEVHWLIENKKLSFLLTGSSARKLRQKHVNLLGGRA